MNARETIAKAKAWVDSLGDHLGENAIADEFERGFDGSVDDFMRESLVALLVRAKWKRDVVWAKAVCSQGVDVVRAVTAHVCAMDDGKEPHPEEEIRRDARERGYAKGCDDTRVAMYNKMRSLLHDVATGEGTIVMAGGKGLLMRADEVSDALSELAPPATETAGADCGEEDSG